MWKPEATLSGKWSLWDPASRQEGYLELWTDYTTQQCNAQSMPPGSILKLHHLVISRSLLGTLGPNDQLSGLWFEDPAIELTENFSWFGKVQEVLIFVKIIAIWGCWCSSSWLLNISSWPHAMKAASIESWWLSSSALSSWADEQLNSWTAFSLSGNSTKSADSRHTNRRPMIAIMMMMMMIFVNIIRLTL